jgi:hypothetical protein
MNANAPPELDDVVDEFFQRLANDDLFSTDQEERGVRRRVGPADVVRVDDDHPVVEPS